MKDTKVHEEKLSQVERTEEGNIIIFSVLRALRALRALRVKYKSSPVPPNPPGTIWPENLEFEDLTGAGGVR